VELEKDKDALRRALDRSTEDYNIVLAGCKILAAEHDQLKLQCESLQAEMAQNRSDA
jgi:hypothetical protein